MSAADFRPTTFSRLRRSHGVFPPDQGCPRPLFGGLNFQHLNVNRAAAVANCMSRHPGQARMHPTVIHFINDVFTRMMEYMQVPELKPPFR